MDIVLSSRATNLPLEEMLRRAKKAGVESVEWCVSDTEIARFLSRENGNAWLDSIRSLLETHGLRLHGICLESKVDWFDDLARIKAAVLLLKALGGSVLRVVFPPEIRVLSRDGAEFLNAIARFASHSASGGGDCETAVRIAYDIDTGRYDSIQPFLDFHRALDSRAVGLSLSCEGKPPSELTHALISEVNQYDLAVFYARVHASHSDEVVEEFLNLVTEVYDGPCVLEGWASSEDRIEPIRQIANRHEFDASKYDYTKMRYPSSWARLFKPFGTMKLEPAEDVTAGAYGMWTYEFQVGAQGIQVGGGLKLLFQHASAWQPVQMDYPEDDGYTRVVVSGNCSYHAEVIRDHTCLCINVLITDGMLREGETITIVLGDTSKGARGIRAQIYSQERFVFHTSVDATGNGIHFAQSDAPALRILGGPALQMKVIAPSTVRVGEPFDIRLRVEDTLLNAAEGYGGTVSVEFEGRRVEGIAMEDIEGNPATKRLCGLRLETPGMHTFTVRDEQNGLAVSSNWIECREKHSDEYNVYWGDIHGHTALMDGVGTVEEFYHFARYVAFLDFCCHSEHMDSFAHGRQASNAVQWEQVKSGAKQHHDEGKFVTFLGYEDSETWDANVYFPTDDAPWHVDWFGRKLFDFAKKHNAIVVPHMTSYPQMKRGYDWNNYDPDVMPVMEIYSCHGASEYFGGERPLRDGEPGGFAVEGLQRGYKIGFIGSSDDHTSRPGNAGRGPYVNGLVAVFAKELSREAIFDALRKRRCYATTNERILADFRVNGHGMGEEIAMEYTKTATVEIYINVCGTDDIDHIDIVKNGRVVHHYEGKGQICECTFNDTLDTPEPCYYYARIRQKDGALAWLSPVFLSVINSSEGGEKI